MMIPPHITRIRSNDHAFIRSGLEYDFELDQVDDYIASLNVSKGRVLEIEKIWDRKITKERFSSIGNFYFWEGSCFQSIQARNLLLDRITDIGHIQNSRIFPIFICSKFVCIYFETNSDGAAKDTYSAIYQNLSEKYGLGFLKKEQFQSTLAPEYLLKYSQERVESKKKRFGGLI